MGGGTLVNGGPGAWTGGQITFNGAVFSNAPGATFDLQTDGSAFVANSGTPLLANGGTLRKAAGSFAPAAGATLTLNGTATLSASASIGGPGNFEVAFGAITNHGTFNIGG